MKKAAYLLIILVFILLVLEAGLRLALTVSTGGSFVRPGNLIYRYYPELMPVQAANISNSDSTLDVLILSCSVLHKEWADIVTEMTKCIKLPAGYRQIKIYNASGIGHGSRDNRVKYDLLKDKQFDVIIYYDAINDSRLNNCPPEVFKDDYSHYLWYDEINHIVSHPEMNITVIPFFYDWMKIRMKNIFVKNAYIPKHFSLQLDWMAYGNNQKSLPCYFNNLQHILLSAQQHNARVLYLTFAYYLPADYTLQKFRDKKLDYTFCDHSRETEIWGTGENVSRFIDSVNRNSKAWVSGYSNASWYDMYKAYPKTGDNFADICHFSPKGIYEFAGITCRQLDSVLIH